MSDLQVVLNWILSALLQGSEFGHLFPIHLGKCHCLVRNLTLLQGGKYGEISVEVHLDKSITIQ